MASATKKIFLSAMIIASISAIAIAEERVVEPSAFESCASRA